MTSESATCCGCYVQHPQLNIHINETFKPSESLTVEEKDCLLHLAAAWSSFVGLPGKHPDDDRDFCDAIHEAQKMIALRVARRVNPETWRQYE